MNRQALLIQTLRFFFGGLLFFSLLSYGAETKVEIKFGYMNGGGFIGQTKIVEGKIIRRENFLIVPEGLRFNLKNLKFADSGKARQIFNQLKGKTFSELKFKSLETTTPGLINGQIQWGRIQQPFTAEYGFFGESEVQILLHIDTKKFKFSGFKINDQSLDPLLDLIITLPYVQEKAVPPKATPTPFKK